MRGQRCGGSSVLDPEDVVVVDVLGVEGSFTVRKVEPACRALCEVPPSMVMSQQAIYGHVRANPTGNVTKDSAGEKRPESNT